jgi:glycosyltransferase involved in cell wall biosynthesis
MPTVEAKESLAAVQDSRQQSKAQSVAAGEGKKQQGTAVCIVVENLPVPLDRRVWKEACALRDAGYRVSVICPKGRGYTAGYELRDGIEIHRHRTFEASRVSGYLLEYSWALLAEFFLTLKVYWRTRFRILQACNPPDTIFVIALFMKLFGVRFVFDQHDLGPELFEAKFGRRSGFFYWLATFLERCSFRAADSCIATNDSFREIAMTRGRKREEKVFVVRNCPDLKTFRRPAVHTPNKFGKKYLVAYVGFMGSQDGLEILLESIEHMVHHDKREDTHFVLVGGGTILDELQAAIAAKHLEGFVSMTGQVTHEEVATWLSSADLGVAPDPKNAMNDKLTMIKILEYMAFSLPVVLFDLEEGRRIAGSAGVYATPNDPVDFAAQVTNLLDNAELRRTLGASGWRRIEESLNWENEKKSLLKAYAAALQRGMA